MIKPVPMVRDVVLVGGGHSHVLFIRKWAMQPLPGVRLTLLSQQVLTPYSGMLPGLIAGHYTFNESHIDLARFCQWAGVRFIVETVSGINLEKQLVELEADRPSIGYDVLSLDTGSTPSLDIQGAAKHSVPVKPVWSFYERWLQIQQRVHQRTEVASAESGNRAVQDADAANSTAKISDSIAPNVAAQNAVVQDQLPYRLGVVGSGAGGFELVMALNHALRHTNLTQDSTHAQDSVDKKAAPSKPASNKNNISLHWFVRSEQALKGRPEKVSEEAFKAASKWGVRVHTLFNVVDVRAKSVVAEDGRVVELDDVLWCTAATAPEWPKVAGLSVDKNGFVQTNAYLQSTSHPNVFATGDIGTQLDTPSSKAGVFAVRQAPYLFKNIRRLLLEKPLKPYVPQRDFLSLMATGGKHAIASRSGFTWTGAWVWHLKNHIDQKFMRQFSDLPPMSLTAARAAQAFELPAALAKNTSLSVGQSASTQMQCSGCGAKVGANVLQSVLKKVQPPSSPDVLIGVAQAQDTAVLNATGHQLVQSVDQISAVCSDPYIFGRIAALHALSDVFTERVKMHSAQALVNLPLADDALIERDLHALMAGAVSALQEERCLLVGGHSATAPELQMGFVVNAFTDVYSETNQNNTQCFEGDAIILTQGLGVGILLAGFMQQKAKGVDVYAALQHMQTSNGPAARLLFSHGASLMTDITGFGLLGHLVSLLNRAGFGAQINHQDIPVLSGADTLANEGIESTLLAHNQHVLSQWQVTDKADAAWLNLLCDPQTGGGILSIVPRDEASHTVTELNKIGYVQACCIGQLTRLGKMELL